MNNEINGKQLFDWVTENDLMLRFDSVEQAQLVVSYFEQSGYVLQIENTGLKQTIIDQEGIHVENITIDDVIDMAVETFYEEHIEEMSNMKKAISQMDVSLAANKIIYANKMMELAKKEYIYGELCKAFDKTTYGKDLNRRLMEQKMQSEIVKSKHVMGGR